MFGVRDIVGLLPLPVMLRVRDNVELCKVEMSHIWLDISEYLNLDESGITPENTY